MHFNMHICTHTHTSQFFGGGKKAPGKRKVKAAAEPIPMDPELEEKISEIEKMAETQVNERLQAMLEDINVTSEVGRQHILGQGLADKRELLRAWILRDHRPSGASQAGPGTPSEFVEELKKFDFSNDLPSENHHATIDKLRVSLSTNGLR